MLGAAFMPHKSTAMLRSFSFARIASSDFLVTAGSTPRSMSLAPSSRMTPSVPSGIDQSSRDNPPEDGVARHAGIFDLDIDALGFERAFELCRKGVLRRQAIACGERIPESDDLERSIGAGAAMFPECKE